jgi:hypothetical protein
MKQLGGPLIALACLIGIGADYPPDTPMETKLSAMAATCLAAKHDTPETAATAVVPCQKLLDDLTALKTSKPPLSVPDLNDVLLVQAMGEARVAASYGVIDGARTARVCAGVEREWTALSQFDKARSPAYASAIDDLIKSDIPTVTLCRKEQGTPAGATKLPD